MPDEYITLLADHEWEDRQRKKVARLIKGTLFKQKASAADVDYSHNRNLDRNMFVRLAILSFVKKKENIILTGPSGVGKSYLVDIGYNGSNCATLFGLIVPSISVQTVPV
jgi:DNA replication protein DnaC